MKKFELNKEDREDVLREIKHFFQENRNEEISEFRASLFLDFILENVGPYIYNQAIEDAYALMSKKIEDLYGLEKRFR